MAKKSTYQLKQLVPEEKPETGTKYIVRKPTKGMKVSDKLRQRKYDLAEPLLAASIVINNSIR